MLKINEGRPHMWGILIILLTPIIVNGESQIPAPVRGTLIDACGEQTLLTNALFGWSMTKKLAR